MMFDTSALTSHSVDVGCANSVGREDWDGNVEPITRMGLYTERMGSDC